MGSPVRVPGRPLRALACLAALLTSSEAVGQAGDPTSGYVALRQAVRDAATDTTVAIVASHPDDRYVLLGAYLRFLYGFRVSAVLFTRGEGGQNSQGPDVGTALGRLRTRETEASATRLGLDAWYLNRLDFGFCRTAEEALDVWGRDATVAELARVLRRIQPDLVLTTHDPSETHGHDLALLDVLPDAVRLASNPQRGLDGVPPIPPPRVFRGGSAADPGDADLILSMDDGIDRARGAPIRRLAYAALAEEHRSQAPVRPIDQLFVPDQRLVAVPIDGPPERRLFGGLPSLFDSRLRDRLGAERFDYLQEDLEFWLEANLGNPVDLVELAAEIRANLLTLPITPGSDLDRRRARRLDAIERVALHALGIWIGVDVSPGAVAVPGEPLPFRITVHNGIRPIALSLAPASRGELTVDGPTTIRLEIGESRRLDAQFSLPRDSGTTSERRASLYRQDRFVLPIRLNARLQVDLGAGEPSELTVPLGVPAEVADPVELSVTPRALLITNDTEELRFTVRLRRNTSEMLTGQLQLRVPVEFSAPPAVDVRQVEVERDYPFRLPVPADALRPGVDRLRVRAPSGSTIVRLHRVDVSVEPGTKVGLVPGRDDATPSVLRALGVETTVLDEATLPTRDLSDLDTIVVDMRAFRHHRSARANFQRLEDFVVRDGGRLVTFYHKDKEFNLEQSGFRGHLASLPLHVGKGRVTREDAPVRVLLPEHPLLTVPNRIRSQDWDGWFQERGLYFPDDYDDAFEELLAMNDPGQREERGALLYGRAGAGEYVYCALALYRQLKNLHPGACRLFANLVSRRPRNR